MKSILVIFVLLSASLPAAADCTGAASCNLVCGATFGFGNTQHCLEFDNTGNVFGRISFIPPCAKPGCFPLAQALVRQPDRSVHSVMVQGNSTPNSFTFSRARITVDGPLAFTGNKAIVKPPAAKFIGFPMLQSNKTPNGKIRFFYLHRSGSTQTAARFKRPSCRYPRA